MAKPSIEQTQMGMEGIAFCIARTLIERDPSLKAPMRANLRKMWELLEEREDHGAADMTILVLELKVPEHDGAVAHRACAVFCCGKFVAFDGKHIVHMYRYPVEDRAPRGPVPVDRPVVVVCR